MGYFLPFYSPNSPKNESFEKMKKTPGDIIILHTCTKNHDQMLYSSWDMVHDRCNCYFSFWVIFCPFTPLTAQKIKVLKKWKSTWRYHILHTCTKNYDQMMCGSWDMVRNRRMDGRTDGQTDRQTEGKSDIQRWVPHLKIENDK